MNHRASSLKKAALSGEVNWNSSFPSLLNVLTASGAVVIENGWKLPGIRVVLFCTPRVRVKTPVAGLCLISGVGKCSACTCEVV